MRRLRESKLNKKPQSEVRALHQPGSEREQSASGSWVVKTFNGNHRRLPQIRAADGCAMDVGLWEYFQHSSCSWRRSLALSLRLTKAEGGSAASPLAPISASSALEKRHGQCSASACAASAFVTRCTHMSRDAQQALGEGEAY